MPTPDLDEIRRLLSGDPAPTAILETPADVSAVHLAREAKSGFETLLTGARTGMARLSDQLEELQRVTQLKLADAQRAQQEIEFNLRNMTEAYESVAAVREAAAEERRACQRETEVIKRQTQEQIAAGRQEREHLVQKLREVVEALESSEAERAKLANELEEERQTARERWGQYAQQLQEALDETRTERDALQAQCAEYHRTAETLERKNESLQRDLDYCYGAFRKRGA